MPSMLDAAPVGLPVSPEQRAVVALGRTFARLVHQMDQLLKPFDLTPTQYNVLRILNGAGPDGLCGSEIGRRLVSQVPDMTRLLDRMAAAGLVGRERDPARRSFVATRLTDAGRQKLVEATPEIDAYHRAQFRRFTPEQLQTFRELLALLEP